MKPREFLIFVVSILAVLALRGGDLFGPFVLPFETGFQEAIAVHHLENGAQADHFLPVFATIDGKNFYHTAHPPLLHLVYYMLYLVFGVGEAVTRLFSLVLLAASALLWRDLAGKRPKWGFAVFPLALLLPLPFILGVTTNYEPLSILMITLIANLELKQRAGLGKLLFAVTLGMLVDWPVYLAAPALLLLRWSDREARRRLMLVVAYEALFFAALLFYQYQVAGEAAFFSHAPARANPAALLSIATWRDLALHYRGIMGAPLSLVGLAAVVAWLGRGRESFRALQVELARPADQSADPGPGGAALFFAVHLGLLLLFAPGLVARHYVHLLYLTPLLLFAIIHCLERLASPGLFLAALVVLGGSRDYLASLDRNPASFALATNYRMYPGSGLGRVETAFSSSAVGAWKFYADVETIFPMSRAAAEWLVNHQPDLVQLDLRHGEVSADAQLLSRGEGYDLLVALPGERVYLRRGLFEKGPPGRAGYVAPGRFILPGRERVCRKGIDRSSPAEPFLWAETSEDCLDPVFTVPEPPGAQGRALTALLPAGVTMLHLAPALIHPLPFARSDGANFLALRESEEEGGVSLAYARFVGHDGGAYKERAVTVDVAGAAKIVLAVLPGPRLDQAFDDALWIEPYYLGRTKE